MRTCKRKMSAIRPSLPKHNEACTLLSLWLWLDVEVEVNWMFLLRHSKLASQLIHWFSCAPRRVKKLKVDCALESAGDAPDLTSLAVRCCDTFVLCFGLDFAFLVWFPSPSSLTYRTIWKVLGYGERRRGLEYVRKRDIFVSLGRLSHICFDHHSTRVFTNAWLVSTKDSYSSLRCLYRTHLGLVSLFCTSTMRIDCQVDSERQACPLEGEQRPHSQLSNSDNELSR